MPNICMQPRVMTKQIGIASDTISMLQRLGDRELPQAMSYEWTDMSYLELLAGNTAMIIFTFAVIMVFLVLAAQYESWSLPLAVIQTAR